MTLTALWQCRDMIGYLAQDTGRHITTVVTSRAVVSNTDVIKSPAGKVGKRGQTGSVTINTILGIGRGRYMTNTLSGSY